MQDGELMAKLLEAFREEARERLEALYSFAEALESGDVSVEKFDGAYREAHSLKGAARAVGLAGVVHVCQELESFIGRLKGEDRTSLQESAERLYSLIKEIESGIYGGEDKKAGHFVSDSIPPEDVRREKSREITEDDHAVVDDAPPVVKPAALPQGYEPAETIRVSVRRLDSLLRRIEELIPIKLASTENAAELKRLYWFVEDVRNRRGDDPDLSYIESILNRLSLRVETTSRQLDLLVDDLMEQAKDVLMQPFSILFQGMGRMVRDLARELGKEAILTVDGEDIEIDRRILEELKDPIIHLLRNAVDHGIEHPEERVRLGKERQGRISVVIKQDEARKISLILRDDGRGLSVRKIRNRVMDLGLASKAELDGTDESQLLHFIFSPGFSTSPTVTELSGRGLGLSIVKEKIESVGGSVSIAGREGEGTEFIIELPVSLAAFRGILVKDSGQRFMVPTHSVDAVVRLEESEWDVVIGGAGSIKYNGRVIPVQKLGSVLGLELTTTKEQSNASAALIINTVDAVGAFAVDEVITEQEGLIKSLGSHLKKVPFVWGATVLGSGEVVPVLNPGDLVRSLHGGSRLHGDVQRYDGQKLPRRKTILVAEDSMTSRTLLKNILEAAGYNVVTAVDGLEALSLLESEEIDLVVSDVEMPRMDGIELTKRIRSKERLKNLPVVLVTGLDSPKDRERGLEAGADAYIVKTDFRQTTLLNVIRRYV